MIQQKQISKQHHEKVKKAKENAKKSCRRIKDRKPENT